MEKLPLKELDLTALRVDLPAFGLITGDVGTILLVHRDGEAYEVEFVSADGDTLAVETLRADQVEAAGGHRVLHVRQLDLS